MGKIGNTLDRLIETFTGFFAKRAVQIGLIVLAVAMVVFTVRSCDNGRQKAEQGKQDTRTSEALAETAKDAAKTVIEQAGEEASIDDLVDQTQKEIENATDEKVSRGAAVRAICSLMPDAGNDPACKLQ